MHHFFLSFVDNAFVPHKLYPIPDLVCNTNGLDRNEASIRENQ